MTKARRYTRLPSPAPLHGGTYETLSNMADNARLIAAAPELYDSLREIMNGQLGDGTWTNAERFRRARALLAKIDGHE